jgi:hypothetical protein
VGAATVSGPSAEHIDAVARAFGECDDRCGYCPEHQGIMRYGQTVCDAVRTAAEAVLSSSDPAVHAAMLDALTRAGVLREEWNRVGARGVLNSRPFPSRIQGEMYNRDGQWMERRYVTEWAEDAP